MEVGIHGQNKHAKCFVVREQNLSFPKNVSVSAPKHDNEAWKTFVSVVANVRSETCNIRFKTTRCKLEGITICVQIKLIGVRF